MDCGGCDPTATNAMLREVQLGNEMMQRELLYLIEESCNSPLCVTMKARMRRLLKKLRGLILVIKRLGASRQLRIKTSESAVASQIFSQKLTFPFLYTAVMHHAFKRYPSAPDGEVRNGLFIVSIRF